jgi:hypothetical protein
MQSCRTSKATQLGLQQGGGGDRQCERDYRSRKSHSGRSPPASRRLLQRAGQKEGEETTSTTYAAALKGNVPLSPPSNLVKARARERQTLIDSDPRAEQNNLGYLTERELVAKANEAISGRRTTNGNENRFHQSEEAS